MKLYQITPGIKITEECHKKVTEFLERKKTEGSPMQKAQFLNILESYLPQKIGVENYEEFIQKFFPKGSFCDLATNELKTKPTKIEFYSKHLIQLLDEVKQ